jgi:hypothetical protein
MKRTKNPQFERVEEDVRQIAALLRGGKSPGEAMAEFRRRLDHESLRDLFAGLAMHRLLDRITPDGGTLLPESVARLSYDQADALLRERSST